jgi:sec-independent protein translocase protein TatB
MFGSSLGFQEILVICVILIVVVGPERLPSMMKGVGKALRTMREASREIRTTVGIDEMLREDVLRPTPPKPRPVPAATVARAPALPAPAVQVANAPPSALPSVPEAEPASTPVAVAAPSDVEPS